MVPLIVLIVVLVAGGGIALLVKSRHSAAAASDEAGSGPNEFLQSPPTSFPSGAGATRSLAAPATVQAVEDDDEEDDEVIVARFKAPGERSVGAAEATRSQVTPPVYHLEAEPEPEPEPEAEVAEVEVEEMAGPVIDLSGDDEAWEDVVLQPEPDAVDHVLEALINRARFKQVEVEAVATELVERADLQGQEVSEVLAELVGRADDSTLDAARTSELTLFNDEVPSRPGQLTDFARLAGREEAHHRAGAVPARRPIRGPAAPAPGRGRGGRAPLVAVGPGRVAAGHRRRRCRVAAAQPPAGQVGLRLSCSPARPVASAGRGRCRCSPGRPEAPRRRPGRTARAPSAAAVRSGAGARTG